MTFAELLSDLTGMSISGVTRVFTAPVASLNTAELPALFPDFPEGDSSLAAMGGAAYDASRTLALNIAIRPDGQGNIAQDYAEALALMDALDTALRELEEGVDYALTWRMRAGLVPVAGQGYRGIVAEVTAREVD